MDRIKAILEGHLKLARDQLEMMSKGTTFDDLHGLSSTEEELCIRIAELEGSLARHEQRMNERR
jgi:hypothetical protein